MEAVLIVSIFAVLGFLLSYHISSAYSNHRIDLFYEFILCEIDKDSRNLDVNASWKAFDESRIWNKNFASMVRYNPDP